jgi:tetratricopeptide (TPR) repeat protein
MYSKVFSALVCIVFICSFAMSDQLHNKERGKAKRHFEQARELEAVNDPQAEQEYKLAIKARRRYYPEAQLRLCLYLGRELRFSEAVSILEEYIKQTPRTDHSSHYEQLKDLQRAANLLKQIDSSNSPSLSDLLDFASIVSRYGRNKLRDAIPYAERAVSLYPTSSEAHVILGRLLIGSQQQARRFEILKRAILLDPKNPAAHHQLGWYYIERLNGEEACKEFREALELSSGELADSWQGLGHALVLQGKKKEAIEAFYKYLKSGQVPKHFQEVIEQKIKDLEKKSRH